VIHRVLIILIATNRIYLTYNKLNIS